MRLSLLCSSLALVGTHAVAGESSYYLDLVNASPDSIRSLSIAAADSDRYVAIPIGDRTLRGGGDVATVRIRSDGASCLRNIRLTFVTGYTFTQRAFNVCHRQRLTVMRSRDDETRTASANSGR